MSTAIEAGPAAKAAHAPKAARDVFVLPGQIWCGADARSVTTLLGSCCAITLWHPRLRVAAMCHFVLPRRDASDRPAGDPLDGRYGDDAMALMRAALAGTGAPLSQFQARIYGGANMFAAFGPSTLDIGARNAEQALAELERHGLAALTVDVCGTAYRRVRMTPATGDVTVYLGNNPVARAA